LACRSAVIGFQRHERSETRPRPKHPQFIFAGAQPIRASWFAVVYPALLLNYLGQGAHLLSGKTVVGGKRFYHLVPQSMLFPMALLATVPG
jgi:K+ transporter